MKWYGLAIGAPGLDPTAAVMRSSNAAASKDCLPFREWPAMATCEVLTRGGAACAAPPVESAQSSTRDATNARLTMFAHLAYTAWNLGAASRTSLPG